jgi:hypothetical protein
MAKTLKTSGDYTVKAGAGSAGSNTIKLDAKYVRIPGDLTIDGTQTVINSTTLTIEDQFLEVNRNNSTAGTEDSGIFFNQGSSNHAILYYDAGNGEFQVGTTTQDATANSISNITLGQLKVATTPTDANHAASKDYVDNQIVSGGFTIGFRGDDSAVVSVNTGNSVLVAGGSNISTAATEEDTITVSLDRDLNGIDSISTDRSNQDLTLTANGTGEIVIDPVLTFTVGSANPTATSSTKVYNKTAGGGGTGLYFKNSNINSGTEGELISKSKATALAIALG